jgi:hypothetical protein
MGILLREVGKKTRHKAIRQLLSEIPGLARSLKPCLLMSPLSVAQYLPPDTRFDVVVFDEASQIAPHDAVGTIARGRQAIVVGDPKQLPPTSFFTRAEADDDELSDAGAGDENDLAETESILDECMAAGFPQLTLNWHYRSQDESLISFSNTHFYGGGLFTFPAAHVSHPSFGVTSRKVAGVYDKGGKRDNAIEARAVVKEVVARLLDPHESRRSLGIVTFSMPQKDLIEDLLEEARQAHPALEPFFSTDKQDYVFVKNLESVQGDERDVIIFSTCYGPDRDGNVSVNFGPLNRDGGQRRLNVAVTRAREQLMVFTSMEPDQIDLRKTRAAGVRHLQAFLQHAQLCTNTKARQVRGDGADEAPLTQQVAEALRARGHQVQTNVGRSAIRLDLAVLDPSNPERFKLGVVLDGPGWASVPTARDRERLCREVLGRLGWRLHGVSALEWRADPKAELVHLLDALSSDIPRAKPARATAPPMRAPVLVAAAPPAPAPPVPIRSPEEVFAAHGLEVIDKRPAGGAFWVVGGAELAPVMDELKRQGIHFTFLPGGGKATGHRPSWFGKATPQ